VGTVDNIAADHPLMAAVDTAGIVKAGDIADTADMADIVEVAAQDIRS
jgi:hypothetical protein